MRLLGLLLMCVLYSCQNSNDNHEFTGQNSIENTAENEIFIEKVIPIPAYHDSGN